MSNKRKIALEVLEEYKKEHKKNWYDFAKGFLLGYMHDSPKYKEPLDLNDFEEWLKSELVEGIK